MLRPRPLSRRAAGGADAGPVGRTRSGRAFRRPRRLFFCVSTPLRRDGAVAAAAFSHAGVGAMAWWRTSRAGTATHRAPSTRHALRGAACRRRGLGASSPLHGRAYGEAWDPRPGHYPTKTPSVRLTTKTPSPGRRVLFNCFLRPHHSVVRLLRRRLLFLLLGLVLVLLLLHRGLLRLDARLPFFIG